MTWEQNIHCLFRVSVVFRRIKLQRRIKPCSSLVIAYSKKYKKCYHHGLKNNHQEEAATMKNAFNQILLLRYGYIPELPELKWWCLHKRSNNFMFLKHKFQILKSLCINWNTASLRIAERYQNSLKKCNASVKNALMLFESICWLRGV